MQRTTASDYPQELVDIVQLYQRGGISRRGFLNGAAKFAVGGLTAAALLENIRPADLLAQQVRKRPQRVAIVGVAGGKTREFHITIDPEKLTAQ